MKLNRLGFGLPSNRALQMVELGLRLANRWNRTIIDAFAFCGKPSSAAFNGRMPTVDLV